MNVTSNGYVADIYGTVSRLDNNLEEKQPEKKVEEQVIENAGESVVETFPDVTASSNEILGIYNSASLNINITKNTIPEGYSQYKFRGARLDIFKKGDEYQSQVTTPEDVDEDDLKNRYPEVGDVLDKTEANKISGVNGLIDENVIQGSTNDCWLIAGVCSLNSNEKGREIIQKSIIAKNDGSVKVKFAGIGVNYTVSADEIRQYDTDDNKTDAYSNGDNDMLALELATEKLWQDINSGKIVLNANNTSLDNIKQKSCIDDGGLPSQIIYCLTGVQTLENYYSDARNLNEQRITSVLQKALDSDSKILNFALYYDEHSATLIDGTNYSFNAGNSGHSFAITDVTEDTVTFVNPWDISTSYTMSWSEFVNLGVGYLSIADLSKAKMPNNQMTNTKYDFDIIDLDDDKSAPSNTSPNNSSISKVFKKR